MSEVQATLFNKKGFPIGDVIATFERSWVLNDFGECNFIVTVSTIQSNPSLFQKGNFILLEQDTLPDWIGYLDTPETWGHGEVQMMAYSAERIFELRPGLVDTLYGSAGSIFERIIEMANSWGDTLLRPGNIYKGGTQRQESFSPANQLLDDVMRITERSGTDWDVTPEIVNGQLQLLANLYSTKKTQIDYALVQGVNIETNPSVLEYEGEIWNQVTGFGNGATWVSRETYTEEDPESIELYGRRSIGLPVESNSLSTIKVAVERFLQFYKQPRKRLDFTTTGSKVFPWLRIGNVPDVELISLGLENDEIGFLTTAEIIELIYQHSVNKMQIILREELI